MKWLILLILAIPDLVVIPPLDPGTRAAIEEAEDDQDIPDPAFIALIDHVRSWPDGARSIGIRLEIDHEDLVETPEYFRGELLVIEGRLEQHRDLGRPFEGIQEWYVQPVAGRPVMVYLPVTGGTPVLDGSQVVIEAYFYKRMSLRDRGGSDRTYPAFVGSQPRIEPPVAASAATAFWPALLGVLALLLVLLLVLLSVARRASRRSLRGGIVGEVDSAVPDPPLPGDPAEALGELERRGSGEDA